MFISTDLFQQAFMTGNISPYSDVVRFHYPRGGPAAKFTMSLGQVLNCSAGAGRHPLISCIKQHTGEEINNAVIKLYQHQNSGGLQVMH